MTHIICGPYYMGHIRSSPIVDQNILNQYYTVETYFAKKKGYNRLIK